MASRHKRRQQMVVTATLLTTLLLGGCSSALNTVCISGLRTQAHLVEGQSDQLRNLLIREAEILTGSAQSPARDAALNANRELQSATSLMTQFWNTAPASTKGDAASMDERVQLDGQRLQNAQSAHEEALTTYTGTLPSQDSRREVLVTSRNNVREVTAQVQTAMTNVRDVTGACR